METGKFYFLKDNYYDSHPNCGLMGNKDDGDRPVFYCFKDGEKYWMIHISSKVDKYMNIYEKKIKRYKSYEGIRFGFVNGKKRAFLIQNMCPVTVADVHSQYFINKNTVEVTISSKTADEVTRCARKLLHLYKCGYKVTMTDLDKLL